MQVGSKRWGRGAPHEVRTAYEAKRAARLLVGPLARELKRRYYPNSKNGGSISWVFGTFYTLRPLAVLLACHRKVTTDLSKFSNATVRARRNLIWDRPTMACRRLLCFFTFLTPSTSLLRQLTRCVLAFAPVNSSKGRYMTHTCGVALAFARPKFAPRISVVLRASAAASDGLHGRLFAAVPDHPYPPKGVLHSISALSARTHACASFLLGATRMHTRVWLTLCSLQTK